MWSENVKNFIVKLKSDNQLREMFIQNPETVDLSDLTKEEKLAVSEVFTSRRLASDVGTMSFWA